MKTKSARQIITLHETMTKYTGGTTDGSINEKKLLDFIVEHY